MSTMSEFRAALRAVYDGDSTVQATTHRKSGNLRARGAQSKRGTIPLVTYHIVSSPQRRGTKGQRNILVQLEAWAKESMDQDAVFDVLDTLMDRAEALFTGTQLAAQGVDAYRTRITNRYDGFYDPEDCIRSLRADMEFVASVT